MVNVVKTVRRDQGWRLQLIQTNPAQTGQSPVEILKARYARGGITREQYEQVRQDL